MLTESQLAALEKAKSEKEADGEFESECPETIAAPTFHKHPIVAPGRPLSGQVDR